MSNNSFRFFFRLAVLRDVRVVVVVITYNRRICNGSRNIPGYVTWQTLAQNIYKIKSSIFIQNKTQ